MTAEASSSPLDVVVVGGGVAALETLVALKSLAGDRTRTTLLAPNTEFVYRPLTVAEPFGRGAAKRYALGSIASDLGVDFVQDAFAELDGAAREVTTAAGETLPYDVLVLAVGARARPPFAHTMTFGLERDPEAFNGLLADLEQGYSGNAAFIVPAGTTWSLPIYELALMTAGQAAGMGMTDVRCTIVTPEERPLAIFGPTVSAEIGEMLERAGIDFQGSTYARQAGGDIVLEPEGRVLRADRTVALPVLEGPRLEGVPANPGGFMPTDLYGRVDGLADVFAAGDGTAFPIKQGGLATQQADAVAQTIAARAGVDLDPLPFRPVLRGMILTDQRPRYLRTAVTGGDGEGTIGDHCLWWPPTKIAGRYLAPYLTGRDEGELRQYGLGDRHAVPVEALIAPEGGGERPRKWIIAHGQGEQSFELLTDQS